MGRDFFTIAWNEATVKKKEQRSCSNQDIVIRPQLDIGLDNYFEVVSTVIVSWKFQRV